MNSEQRLAWHSISRAFQAPSKNKPHYVHASHNPIQCQLTPSSWHNSLLAHLLPAAAGSRGLPVLVVAAGSGSKRAGQGAKSWAWPAGLDCWCTAAQNKAAMWGQNREISVRTNRALVLDKILMRSRGNRRRKRQCTSICKVHSNTHSGGLCQVRINTHSVTHSGELCQVHSNTHSGGLCQVRSNTHVKPEKAQWAWLPCRVLATPPDAYLARAVWWRLVAAASTWSRAAFVAHEDGWFGVAILWGETWTMSARKNGTSRTQEDPLADARPVTRPPPGCRPGRAPPVTVHCLSTDRPRCPQRALTYTLQKAGWIPSPSSSSNRGGGGSGGPIGSSRSKSVTMGPEPSSGGATRRGSKPRSRDRSSGVYWGGGPGEGKPSTMSCPIREKRLDLDTFQHKHQHPKDSCFRELWLLRDEQGFFGHWEQKAWAPLAHLISDANCRKVLI